MSLRPISKILFAATFAVFVAAGTAQALTIAPARIEITGDAGTTLTGEFLLTNEEPGSRTFYTSAQNFEARGETGTPNFTDGETGLASWLSVPSEVTLGEGEELPVAFSISVPADAEPGGHFAAIFLSTVPPGDAQVSIGAKVGVLVLLRVSGDVIEGGGVTDFTSNGKFFTSIPVLYSYRFTNDGGDRVNPRGSITVRNLIGLKKTEFLANPGEGNVLPNSTRKFESAWGDTAVEKPKGFFSAVAYEWQNFAFGPYRAKLDLAYGVDGKATANTWVFVFPWHLLTIVLAMLIVVLPLLLVGLRRYNRWIIASAQQRR